MNLFQFNYFYTRIYRISVSSGLFSFVSGGDLCVRFVGVVIMIGDRSPKFNSVLCCVSLVGVYAVAVGLNCGCVCACMSANSYSSWSYE